VHFTTVTTEKRYAPDIALPKLPHLFLAKAAVYNAVQERIMDLGQHTDTYFKVFYHDAECEVYYGPMYQASVATDTHIVPVTGWYSIPAGAIKIAEAAVVAIFESL
jgi:hypothetical protein